MASRNPILFDAGASRQSVALARDWHTGNWISVEHVDEKRFCAKGTRPGDVLADLAFDVAMSWVIYHPSQVAGALPRRVRVLQCSSIPYSG